MARGPTARMSTWASRCRGEEWYRGGQYLMKSHVLFAASLALAACAVGRGFKPPVNPTAALINAYSADRSPLVTQSMDGLWWQQFGDPVLNELIGRALETNLDLAMAVDRVRAARAAFSGAELDYAPHVPVTAGYTHAKEQQPGFGTQRFNAESYTAGLDASWELDLVGHARRSVEAARGDLAGDPEALQNGRVTVPAGVRSK